MSISLCGKVFVLLLSPKCGIDDDDDDDDDNDNKRTVNKFLKN
jgi:hypothetical protein